MCIRDNVHTVRYFVSLANEMARAGADSICIKDMAGVRTPDVAFELVSEIKASCDLPLQVHTHDRKYLRLHNTRKRVILLAQTSIEA